MKTLPILFIDPKQESIAIIYGFIKLKFISFNLLTIFLHVLDFRVFQIYVYYS